MQGADMDQANTETPESLGEQGRTLKREARAAASKAGDKVKSTLQEQAATIGDKARSVASETAGKLGNKFSEQRASGADYLENVASLVHQAAGIFDFEVPRASGYIHQAADQIETVADAVRTKSAREVVHDVQGFARQQPAIFLGGAMLLGFAAVRVFKASPADTSPSDSAPRR